MTVVHSADQVIGSIPTEQDDKPVVIVKEKTGFLVWTKIGPNPRVYHPTRATAEAEASRLAAKHPGKAFFVVAMASKHKAVVAVEQPLAEAA